MPKSVYLLQGATSGIGEATARAFAKEGENLIPNRVRRVERLQALKEEAPATYQTKRFGLLHWMLPIWTWSRMFAKPFSKVWGRVHILSQIMQAGTRPNSLSRL